MSKVFRLLVAVLLLGGCYTQFKATKQVDKALAHYPQIVAKIALDSFPCNVIRIDTNIVVSDTIVEYQSIENYTSVLHFDTVLITKKVYVKLPYKTIYITKVVESTAKLVIQKASLDSSNNAICELQKVNDELIGKIGRKNKVIYWLIGLLILLTIPLVIRIFKMLSINI